MKKPFYLAVMLILILSVFPSCTKNGVGKVSDVMSYQEENANIRGTWIDSGKEYEIEMTLSEKNGDERNTEITFLSPDTLKGIKFIYRDTFLTASLGDMAIELQDREPDTVMRLGELFTLSSDDITDVSVSKNDTTTIKGKNKSSVWQITTNGDGLPTEIGLTKGNSSSRFIIEEFSIVKPEKVSGKEKESNP